MSGTYKNKSGQVYTGDFENFELNGAGSLAEKGIVYKGMFAKGVLTTVVSINYGGGIVYEGPTVGFLRQGYGYVTYSNGKIQYVGDWVNDKKNGEGAVILENGNHLIGAWVDDKEEGNFNLYDSAYVLIKTLVYTSGAVLKQTTVKKTVVKPSVPSVPKAKPVETEKKPALVVVETKKDLNVKPAAVTVQPAITSFDKKEPFQEGRAVVRKDGKYGYIDETGRLVIPLLYDDAIEFEEGLGMVKLGNKIGFIDRAGKVIIPIAYDQTGFWFKEGINNVQLNNKWGFINNENKIIVPLIYDETYGFKEGLAAVRSNEKWGFIDKNGQVVIELKYDDLVPFEEGVASVSIAKKWGYINLAGKEVIPVTYDAVYPVVKGVIKAKLNGKLFYFDTQGKPINQ